jgi:hypothetical protein
MQVTAAKLIQNNAEMAKATARRKRGRLPEKWFKGCRDVMMVGNAPVKCRRRMRGNRPNLSALPPTTRWLSFGLKFKDVFANNDAAAVAAFPAGSDFSGVPIEVQSRQNPSGGRVQIVTCVPSSTTRPGGSR